MKQFRIKMHKMAIENPKNKNDALLDWIPGPSVSYHSANSGHMEAR